MEVILKKSSIFLAAVMLVAFFPHQSPAAAGVKDSGVVELPKEAVSKIILENGLVILAKDTSPENLVAIDVKIRAGSSLEEEYLGSGISHLVEHMLFKGTPTRGPGQIEKEIKSYGGLINGSTSQDLTEYNVIVRAEYAPQALSLLKDMLLNATFDKTEFDKEKDVILKELRLDNDEPQNLLIRLLNETAYLSHTYKYPPIGYERRFRSLTREDAIKYYNRMYAPNRIALAIVGGVQKNSILSKAEAEFKDFRPPNYDVIGFSPAEPFQIDTRYAEKKIETNLSYVAIGYHSTSVLNEDLFAMDLLSMILGRGDNSRLNTALLKKERLVHSISSWNFTPRDPGLFVITALLDTDKLVLAEDSIKDQVAKVRSGLFDKDELEGAKRMVLGDYISGLQTVDAQASDMASNYLLTGSYDFSRRYVKGIQDVSAADLKRVANKYLRDDGATAVRIVSESFKNPSEVIEPGQPAEASLRMLTLPNGIRIIIRQNKKTPAASMTVAIGGGLASENKTNNGISNLLSAMLLKGTTTRREEDIAGAIEKAGGSINPFGGFNSFGIDIEFLKPDLEMAISLMQDVLTNSTFPPEELDKARSITLAMIREEDDDIFQTGINLFRKELFAASQYGLRYLGEEDSVKSLTREELVDYYKKYVIPNNMVISVSGDFDPDDAANKLTKAFSVLKTKDMPGIKVPQEIPDKPKVKNISMEKEQSLVVLGFVTTNIKDPDRYALDVLSSVLSGYSGRLFDSLRNKLFLAYSLGCIQKTMTDTGFFFLYAATTKENILPVENGLTKEIGGILNNGITDEELILAKRELTTGFEIKKQTNGFFARTTAIDELCGLGYEDIFKYGESIDKVTKGDVRRVAGKYFNLNGYAEVVISGEK